MPRSFTIPFSWRHRWVRVVSVELLISQSLNDQCRTAEYFRDCLKVDDLDALNIEIIRNTLYKAYLEDFERFCQSLGGPTADVMGRILAFEADRRAINITINSIGTELTKEQRARLFPTIGRLFPGGNNMLAKADDIEQVRIACESVTEYRAFFEGVGANGGVSRGDEEGAAAQIEDRFFVEEVNLNKMAFLQQFQYGVFYGYVKLKEQEIRNITWISECIAQEARNRIQDFIPLF
jgi:V-type H+-transporting ATPase subunit d